MAAVADPSSAAQAPRSTIYESFSVTIPTSKSVSSIAVDQNGSHCILAGKQGLHIIDLEKPEKIKKTLTIPNNIVARASSHCLVQWNPHAIQKNLAISSNGKFIYLWDVGRTGRNLLSKVDAHTRAIQGLCWSSKDVNLFASCSLDTYINVWDVRMQRAGNQEASVIKFKTFCSWTDGASDVKWNRFNNHRVASCHGGEVRVWDLRKEATPMTFITAHNMKISNIDWSYTREYELLTCGQDKSVKFWNINTPRVTTATLTNTNTCSSARFLPLGDAFVTVRKEENIVNLWRLSDLSTPVSSITTHSDIVTSYDFRMHVDAFGAQTQIVSISRDNELRLTPIPPKMLKSCGYSSHISTSVGSSRDSNEAPVANMDLSKEFTLLDTLSYPGLLIKERDIKDRYCVIYLEQNSRSLELKVIFPTMYPNSAYPNFFIISTTLSATQKAQYLQSINNISQSTVQQNAPCLEQIILFSIEFLDLQHSNSNLVIEDKKHTKLPIPRLAGATFTADGKLVYFHNISFQNSANQSLPYTYQGLIKYLEHPVSATEQLQPVNETVMSYYYYDAEDSNVNLKTPNRVQKSQSLISQPVFKDLVLSRRLMLVDVSNLMILNKNLAVNYKISGATVKEACEHNAKICSAVDRPDLCKIWNLMNLISDEKLYKMPKPQIKPVIDTSNEVEKKKVRALGIQRRRYASLPFEEPAKERSVVPHFNADAPIWASHPFAEHLIASVFAHYEQLRDVQTLAVLSCVLSLPPNPIGIIQKNILSEGFHSPQAQFSQKKLNVYRKVYSEILFQWGKPEQAVEILRHCTDSAKTAHLGLEFGVNCKKCGKQLSGNYCSTCKRRAFPCALCNLPVRGLSTFCFNCGHGGHTDHMKEWFEKEDVCAMGCGCRCLQTHGFIGRR